MNDKTQFPSPEKGQPDGLIAIGGDLSPNRLLSAYRQGIFPWYEGEFILWWCPDPRFVLLPSEFKIHKTVKKLIKQEAYSFTINKSFREVIGNCKKIVRKGQEGTWITDEMQNAYIEMHNRGYAHSAEVWKDGVLIGGLYGIRLGKVFFGESMFSILPYASRFAMTRYMEILKKEGVELIDCQVYSEYLESMGAKMMDRKDFIGKLKELCHS